MGDETLIGKWEFPGWKVEPIESELSDNEREIKEEFELDIKTNKFIVNDIREYPSKIVDLKLYECEYKSGKFHLHDYSEYKYVTLDGVLDYDLVPTDIPLVNNVKDMRQRVSS